jgi:hypothetical protein
MMKFLFSKSFSFKDAIIRDHLKTSVSFWLLEEILGFIKSAQVVGDVTCSNLGTGLQYFESSLYGAQR